MEPARDGDPDVSDDVSGRGAQALGGNTTPGTFHSWTSKTRVAEELRVADEPGVWGLHGGSDDQTDTEHGHSHGGAVHEHSHEHDDGDEALLHGGVSHGHSHGGGRAGVDGSGLTRGLTTVFRALGLLSLAAKLRDSLFVVAAAWAFLVSRPDRTRCPILHTDPAFHLHRRWPASPAPPPSSAGCLPRMRPS